ncbi:MAG: PilC/PilY family type IV pilus protein, partial [Burkholderiales bacterium]
SVLPTRNDCLVEDSIDHPHTANGATPGTTWEKVRIDAASQQNFANWYSYYRTRLLMAKTSAGLAFAGLNDSFRVGFVTICPDPNSSCGSDGTTVKPEKYLAIDTFSLTQKDGWYKKLYSQTGSSWTPLREALSRAGRHFAGKQDGINSGMTGDPIQYSCQANYTILTTDGYWNYGRPKRLDSSSMGQQDGNLGLTPRPMYDGGAVTGTETVERIEERYSVREKTTNPNRCRFSDNKGFLRTETWKVTTTTNTPQFGTPNTTTSSQRTSTSDGACQSPKPTAPATKVVSTNTTSSVSEAGGVGDTLADVADYYYRNDLRPTMDDNVPESGTTAQDDRAKHQHMTTFTVGLGVSGNLKFQSDYKTAKTGDFADIVAGRKGWPSPDPANTEPTNTFSERARIDDLWHAAVNGRGQAFSATNPANLTSSLQTALGAIQAQVAAAAAAATSSLEPTQTDRLAFLPKYQTRYWTGELEAHEIDLDTGAILPTVIWSAQTKLEQKTGTACDNRTIWLHKPGATNNLVPFAWNSAACDGSGNPSGKVQGGAEMDDEAKKLFEKDKLVDLTQWSTMSDEQKSNAEKENLVNFLRGQRAKENFEVNNEEKLYRGRQAILGDIANSQPVFTGPPQFDYADAGYIEFKTKVKADGGAKDRSKVVYVGANDGMLHAFYAGESTSDPLGGQEAWAFIPRTVLPRLYKLADTNWAGLHEYYSDGTPTIGDVYDSTANRWRTILVSGLNKGGRGYYAVDITDPANPVALWEFQHSTTCFGASNKFSDCHLGFTYGNPAIGKLKNGRWVVVVTSGYNNVNAPSISGDGQGYLYVVDAVTGEILNKIGTGVGDSSTPSGLNKIRAFVRGDANVDNTVDRVYGVDLLGNIWRFDVNDERDASNNPVYPPAGREATRLATVKDASGNPQPITSRPEVVAEAGSPPSPFVFVATGRYLHADDVTDASVQSVYAIKDALTTTPYTNLRTELRKLKITTSGTDRRAECDLKTTGTVPACATPGDSGWYVDLPDAGERVNVDMRLQLGQLVMLSNVPGNTACEPAGYSYKTYFDFNYFMAGAAVTPRIIGSRFASSIGVGVTVVRLPDGRVVAIGMESKGTPKEFQVPFASAQSLGKRITWRELVQ